MITVLGKQFTSEDERREYFRNELRNKLPELKQIEGFPIGEDEDIIALSDPPYYTACPNPWLNDFIAEWEQEKENIPNRVKDFHVAEPYASDVSEGKNNPIYNAHSYHTKVPHPAIMRYILHYTQPGDIVLDAFAGTGMTGVAANFCEHPDSNLRFRIDEEWKRDFGSTPQWGIRKSVIGDLSPIASFIEANYNSVVDLDFERKAQKIISEVESEFSWLYETKHTNGSSGRINYVIWSEVFLCSNCNAEIVFWDSAVNYKEGQVAESFNCPECNISQTKRGVERCMITKYDANKGVVFRQSKFVPVLINYSYANKKFEKRPDNFDLELIEKVESLSQDYVFPRDEIIAGDEIDRLKNNGFTNVNDLFFDRTNIILSRLFSLATESDNKNFKLYLTSIIQRASRLFRWSSNQAGPLMGTYYIASSIFEVAVFNLLKNKSNLIPAISSICTSNKNAAIYCGSATSLSFIRNNSFDYIFTDPPFGANLMYSELNFLWESWLKVKTNNKTEAIENKSQGKTLLDYQDLMTKCFQEYFRVLKSGRWMTVEFSNTGAAVWNGIQTALQRAGFVIANVAALDKKQGSFKAVTTATAVKQDLVISCYKPSQEFETKFEALTGATGVWEFVREHLEHLPPTIKKAGKSTAVVERSPKILYDRLITFYLMRNLPVPIDAADFQAGLRQKFDERDGMFFTKEDAAKYDEEQGIASQKGEQLRLVFDLIYSESDAVLWLQDRLKKRPQTYQDIQPDYRKANIANRKGEIPTELGTLLEENFIQMPDNRWRVPDLNEAKDREALRKKSLMKEFGDYVTLASGGKKLKEVRVEALRVGFKDSWERKDFKTIITVADKIPNNILLEDEQLLMYYDVATNFV